ncbi:MAG: SEL1-like repeat protein [Proteobacteria bacterium]|nr:SEL1-like repeat protein [Pseudomonadota bacterium]
MPSLKMSKPLFIFTLLTISFLCVTLFLYFAAGQKNKAVFEEANNLYYQKANNAASYPLYQQLADKGNYLAQAQIYKMMYLGAGTPEDKTSAQQGFTEVIPHLQKAAEEGEAFAQYLWGYYCDLGFNGSPATVKAVYWYQKAAEQGFAAAQNNLGNNYNNGEDVAQDYTKAVYWFRKAAEQGNVVAQVNLGNKYSNGQGVEQDYTQAFYWYRQAAEQGYDSAQNALGVGYDNGEGVAQDYAKAAYWFRKAAEQGLGIAQRNLGIMYKNGTGVEKDYDTAEDWYNKAIANGYSPAQENLADLQGKSQYKDHKESKLQRLTPQEKRMLALWDNVKSKNYQKALDIVGELEAGAIYQNEQVVFFKGFLHAKLNNYSAAREALDAYLIAYPDGKYAGKAKTLLKNYN